MTTFKKTNLNPFLDSLAMPEGRRSFDPIDFLIEGGDDVEWEGKKIEMIEQDGGGEGGGEDCYSVFSVNNGEMYLKAIYNYYSYDGFNTEYGTVSQVTPRQKTITVYE